MCAFVYRNLTAYLDHDYFSPHICVTTFCQLAHTDIVGRPVIDRLIVMQTPCSETQLNPLLNTNIKHAILYVQTESEKILALLFIFRLSFIIIANYVNGISISIIIIIANVFQSRCRCRCHLIITWGWFYE